MARNRGTESVKGSSCWWIKSLEVMSGIKPGEEVMSAESQEKP